TAVNNHTIDNGNTAVIKNGGTLNLTANTGATLTVADTIRSVADNAKGTINTNGTVAVNDSVVNQILNVVTGQLTVGEAGSAVANALQNVDLTINPNTIATINNKNIVGGTIIDKGTLNIVNAGDITISARMSDSGIINKSGSGEASIAGSADNSGFSGTVNITNGTLSFDENNAGKFFNSSATVNTDNSTLEYTAASGKTLASGSFSVLNLKNGATFDYTAGTGITNINSGFYNSVSGNNNLIFNGGNADRINLNADFNSNDTATFKNTELSLGTNTFASSIVLNDNSTLNLMNQTIANYTFANLTADDTTSLTLDVSLDSVPSADTITITNGSGVFDISQFAILYDNGLFTTEDNSKTVQVINNGDNSSVSIGASDAEINVAWSTNVYEYEISTVKSSGSDYYDSLKFKGISVSNPNSLKAMNNYISSIDTNNVRGFTVVSGSSTYHIGEDLGKTEYGTFTVNGASKEESIISGLRAAGDWTSTGENGSMFELTDTQGTTFNLNNVTLQDAKVTGRGGSAIYSTSANSNINIDNVYINNNESTGNGGAIDIESANSVTISGAGFAGNKSTGGLGGAIYTNTNMTIIDSNFGVGTLNTDKNGQNDIYINGTGTVLTFSTSENTISAINSGLAGNGTFLKTGDGTLNLGGSNAGLSGALALAAGTVDYTADDANDTFAGGSVQIAQGATLVMDISNAAGVPAQSLNNVDGYTSGQNKTSGFVVKTGAGTLNLGGDNSGFTGTATIKGGLLAYVADDANDRYFGGSTVIGDEENPNNTANLTLNIGNVANQTISNISSVTTTANNKHTITKTGAGDIVLSGDNSGFYGQTTIDAGSIIYNPETSNDKYFSGNTVINTNGTLETRITNAIANQTVGNISGSGNFVINNEYTNADTQGRVQLVGTNNNFTGLTDIKSGILAYTNNNGTFVSGNIQIDENGTLEYTAESNADFTNNLVANGTSANGTFQKLGSGTLTVKGDESAFAGKVDIEAGTLA
ncbi:MAG: autotransporter-associated beta strand repeat-containing protein, partial [Alphaproteobacteria bacterium]|nr:autotransporter-associated beta strand repeat-containing protein [Alphaproteobacteria bacterium]